MKLQALGARALGMFYLMRLMQESQRAGPTHGCLLAGPTAGHRSAAPHARYRADSHALSSSPAAAQLRKQLADARALSQRSKEAVLGAVDGELKAKIRALEAQVLVCVCSVLSSRVPHALGRRS